MYVRPVADADRRWQQAIAVEPTNPTWLMGRAHNLLASGDATSARALAQQPERFWATLWPLLGIANQLLSATALAVGTAVILRMHPQRRHYALFTAVPMAAVKIPRIMRP